MIYIVCEHLQVPECRTTVFSDMLAESPHAAMYQTRITLAVEVQ